MKPIDSQLVKTMPSKALILSAAAGFVLAACSRNPKPGTDETGRADTTIVRDTISRHPTDTTTQVMPPTPGQGNVDSTGMRRDTSNVLPRMPDTTNRNLPADSAHVPSSVKPYQGDSAGVNHNMPDTTGKSTDTTGHH